MMPQRKLSDVEFNCISGSSINTVIFHQYSYWPVDGIKHKEGNPESLSGVPKEKVEDICWQ
jgi:hypothetical protein